MGREAAELRYLELKNVLCEKIYEGVLQCEKHWSFWKKMI